MLMMVANVSSWCKCNVADSAVYCCQSLVEPTAFLSAELEPNLLESALYGVFRLLPDLCRVPRGPEPEGVRVLKQRRIRKVLKV